MNKYQQKQLIQTQKLHILELFDIEYKTSVFNEIEEWIKTMNKKQENKATLVGL